MKPKLNKDDLNQNQLKWPNFINSEKCQKSNKILIRQKILEGIPYKLKKNFWFKLINFQSSIKEMNANNKSFDQLSTIQPIDSKCIQKDIARTILNELDKKNEVPLTKLVNAFCNYFPKVGYHSGMTFFMLRLLQILSDQEAFQILSYIFQNDSFNQCNQSLIIEKLFSNNFEWLDQFQSQLNTILKNINPKCSQLFSENGLYPKMFYIIWLKTFFLYKTPLSLSFKIWQLYLLQGPKIWLLASVSIISQIFQNYVKEKDLSQQELLPFILKLYGSLEEIITPQIQNSIIMTIILTQQKNVFTQNISSLFQK